MLRTLAALAFALALALPLAGCASEQPPEAAAAASPEPVATARAYQDVLRFEGDLQGAGYITPAEAGFLGVSSRSQDFEVDDGATHLHAVLTWDLPADLYLGLHGPAGGGFVGHRLDSPVARQIVYDTDDVPAGSWSTIALAQGPAAVAYSIELTIDYAS